MTWPPPPPQPAEVRHRPWDPRHPTERDLVDEHERLLYVVVDEIVEGWTGLSVAAWPHADERGRLRFLDPEGPVEVGTSVESLRALLRSGAERPSGVRIGTTFAVRARAATAADLLRELRHRSDHGEARADDLASIFEAPVDLTSQGRLLAKLATYGAMLSTLPQRLEENWNLVEEEGEDG